MSAERFKPHFYGSGMSKHEMMPVQNRGRRVMRAAGRIDIAKRITVAIIDRLVPYQPEDANG